jgi:GH24 family phage-related lysozyme (muramidase)
LAVNVHPKAIALMHEFEGCRLKAYMPTPNDRPTIGWGMTFYPDGRAVRMGDTITQAQADADFVTIVERFAEGVDAALGDTAASGTEFGAMVALAYNIGIAAFRRSSVLRLHKAGDKAGAARAFLMWNKQAGRVLNGLTRRRQAEMALYLS